MEENNGAGKGDRYRSVDQKKWDNNWEQIFGSKKRKKASPKKKKSKKP